MNEKIRKQLLRLKNQQGFTLVELMVVVAIIALLAATAIPQFRKYQAKSRIAEGRLALAGVYTAEESYYAEYNNYYVCLGFMGYVPSGAASDRYFNVGFSSTTTAHTGMPTACGIAPAASYAYTGTKVPGAATALGSTDLSKAKVNAYTTYSAEALGIVDRDYTTALSAAKLDISEDKSITQVQAGY